jgi:hypothetical protein
MCACCTCRRLLRPAAYSTLGALGAGQPESGGIADCRSVLDFGRQCVADVPALQRRTSGQPCCADCEGSGVGSLDNADIIGKKGRRGDEGRSEGRKLVGNEEAPEHRKDVECLTVLCEGKDQQKEDKEARRCSGCKLGVRVSLLHRFRGTDRQKAGS